MLENALALDPQVRDLVVETKVTCPFLGSLVHQELLSVRGAADNPLVVHHSDFDSLAVAG
jgi:hypothetical protein